MSKNSDEIQPKKDHFFESMRVNKTKVDLSLQSSLHLSLSISQCLCAYVNWYIGYFVSSDDTKFFITIAIRYDTELIT
jgi:hypothetical protein